MAKYVGYIFKPLHLRTILQVSAPLARRWIIAKYGDQEGQHMIEHLEMFESVVTEKTVRTKMEELGVETKGGKVLFVHAYDVDTKHTMPPSILA